MNQTEQFEKNSQQLSANTPMSHTTPGTQPTKSNYVIHPENQTQQADTGFINPITQIPQPSDNYMGAVYGEEVKSDIFFNFSDEAIRKSFIKKVFSIVSVQLSITMAMTCWFLFEKNTKYFVQTHIELIITAFIIEIVVLIALICFGELRRKTPVNYILLFIFTVSKSILVATLASFYDVLAVALAVGFTVLVCVGLTMFALQTKWDFTILGAGLYILFLIFFCFGISCFFLMNEIAQLIYASIGALIFSFFLVYDIQIMMGGTHRYTISPEEYVFAALNIFIDVVQIFVYILRIVGAGR